MTASFKAIGLMGRIHKPEVADTLKQVIQLLQKLGHHYWVADDAAKHLLLNPKNVCPTAEIAQHVDLVIVVGGDGSLLRAAQVVVDAQIPLVGINRGRFGFLADIAPGEIEKDLTAILQGEYTRESRFLLETEVPSQQIIRHALNDIVLASGNTAHMMEFEAYVDGQFMCSEHSDGMICATPTGSTAYALSGGGPIIHPASNAIVLVPMFSHTLNSRAIVLNAASQITFKIGHHLAAKPLLSCDGDTIASLNPDDEIQVRRKSTELSLLHPKHYQYFSTLGRKLNWGKKLIHNPGE